MERMRHPDGTVHHSLLNYIGLSPAHYRQACIDAAGGGRKATRAMNVGTIAHRLLLGQRDGHVIVKWDGDRRGNAWKDFEAANAGSDIVTAKEWAAAELVAKAVREDPVAGPMLAGARYEVPLKWTDAGIECSTDGVDIIGRGFIGDLKFTNSAEPRRFQRHALNMSWVAQMAFYADGAAANGIDTSMGVLLFACECSAPYPVTVHLLTAEMLDYGRKTYIRWMERLRVCEENDHWPGYATGVMPFDVPPWMVDESEEGVDDEGEAAA